MGLLKVHKLRPCQKGVSPSIAKCGKAPAFPTGQNAWPSRRGGGPGVPAWTEALEFPKGRKPQRSRRGATPCVLKWAEALAFPRRRGSCVSKWRKNGAFPKRAEAPGFPQLLSPHTFESGGSLASAKRAESLAFLNERTGGGGQCYQNRPNPSVAEWAKALASPKG